MYGSTVALHPGLLLLPDYVRNDPRILWDFVRRRALLAAIEASLG